MKIPVLIGKILTIAAITAMVFVFYTFNPASTAFFPKCTFYALTGWQCPGCGAQRAVFHLLHFQFRQAFFDNPLFVLSLPYLLMLLTFNQLRLKNKFPVLHQVLAGKKTLLLFTTLVLLFWLGRNFFSDRKYPTPASLRSQIQLKLLSQ